MKMFHQLAGVAGVLTIAGTCVAQLSNTGFDDPTFSPWLTFDNVFQVAGPANSAPNSAQLFGNFSGSPNTAILQQTIFVGVNAGDLFSASLVAQQLSADPVTPGTAGFASIEFLNGIGDIIEINTETIAAVGGPLDSWEPFNWSADAPTGTFGARLTIGFFQFSTEPGAVYVDDADLVNDGMATGLLNPSFDSFVPDPSFAPTAGVIPRWTIGGSNIFQNPDFPRTGTYGALIFGEFTGSPNTQILFQDLPATPGNRYDASAFAAHLGGDSLTLDNVAFVGLEFRDGADNLLTVTQDGILDPTVATDQHFQGIATATAPAGATTARVLIGFSQPNNGVGAGHYDDADLLDLGPADGLINPAFDTVVLDGSFNLDPLQPVPGWDLAGFNGSAVDPNVGQLQPDPTPDAQSFGDYQAFMNGQFTGVLNDTVMFQQLPAQPGDFVDFSAEVQMPGTDPLLGDNILVMLLDFFDAGDQVLNAPIAALALSSNSPTDVWLPINVGAVAPAGTVKVQATFLFQQQNDATGVGFIDDALVTIGVAPGGACCVLNCSGPGAVEACFQAADATECQALGGTYKGDGTDCGSASCVAGVDYCIGDIDGDGSTLLSDFGQFSANFGQSVPPGTGGDVDCDGQVLLSDFGAFSANFGCTSTGGAP